MTDAQLVRALRRIDLFEKFKTDTLVGLVRACPTVRLADGDVLFRYGSTGSTLYIVLEGQLQVFRGPRIIAEVGANEYIGELALLESLPRSASVRALGDATLLEMPREAFHTYLRSDPEAMAAMMRTISRRLRKTLDDTQAAYEQVNLLVHDMLNLVNILGGASIVLDGLPADDGNRKFLEFILAAQDSLRLMMQSALQKARGTEAPYVMEPARLDTLVRDCLERDLALHADLQFATIDVQVETPIEEMLCNVLDMRRVIVNLVLNAAQARPAGTTITIRLQQDAEHTRLFVSDTGPGIPTPIAPLIFEPHFTTRCNGNGLGLSSCRDIVERLHHGTLKCVSAEGRGTTFTCELPRQPLA